MHFSLPTFWAPSDAFLHGPNPTVGGNCQVKVTGTSNDSQTAGFWPCLRPGLFSPPQLDVEQWMEAAAALGMREICLTAKHFGGFALWPTNFSNYSVASTAWQGGKGDVLREFADAANRWGIKICYYCNPRDDGHMAQEDGVGPMEFERRQLGMLGELMENYGPVNRFWFDGGAANPPANPEARPNGTDCASVYAKAFALIREKSPPTLVSPYHGDICARTGSLYLSSAPKPNSTDPAGCSAPNETGQYFHPSEMHGITMQEGPDGNTDSRPTYWFWHPWACAGNITGCPWVGHSNASRIFDGYIATVGHGGVLNMNIAPTASGRLNASVVAVMREAGRAINDTFRLYNAGTTTKVISGVCQEGVAVLDVKGEFDFIVSLEDLSKGQRIGNYSVDYKLKGRGSTWQTLVPPVQPPNATRLRDRPDGHDPRDQYVGHKRIDVPIVPTSGVEALPIAQVRFNCHRLVESVEDGGAVHLRSFSLHKKRVPWN
jgi:alpha-L-fucosidase